MTKPTSKLRIAPSVRVLIIRIANSGCGEMNCNDCLLEDTNIAPESFDTVCDYIRKEFRRVSSLSPMKGECTQFIREHPELFTEKEITEVLL